MTTYPDTGSDSSTFKACFPLIRSTADFSRARALAMRWRSINLAVSTRGIHALVATDLEFHAPGLEHEKILGRIAELVEDAALGELLAPCELRERLQRGFPDAVEKLPHVERRGLDREVGTGGEQRGHEGRGLAAKVERIALARKRIALQRRLRDAERRAGADIPLPQVHVAGEGRAVEEAFAERNVLVRAHGLIGEIIVPRAHHQQLQPISRFTLDHAIRRNLTTRTYESLIHAIN